MYYYTQLVPKVFVPRAKQGCESSTLFFSFDSPLQSSTRRHFLFPEETFLLLLDSSRASEIVGVIRPPSRANERIQSNSRWISKRGQTNARYHTPRLVIYVPRSMLSKKRNFLRRSYYTRTRTRTRTLHISTFTYIDSKWIVATFNLQSGWRAVCPRNSEKEEQSASSNFLPPTKNDGEVVSMIEVRLSQGRVTRRARDE